MPQSPQSYKPTSSENVDPKSTKSRLIFVGEDDIDDQEFLKEIFVSIDAKLDFKFAINGTHVLSCLESCEDSSLPCLIVLDYNMPELNGAEILKELHKIARYNNIPKVIWSTSQSTTYKDICMELGATDYVVKPSSINALVEVVRHMLSYCNR